MVLTTPLLAARPASRAGGCGDHTGGGHAAGDASSGAVGHPLRQAWRRPGLARLQAGGLASFAPRRYARRLSAAPLGPLGPAGAGVGCAASGSASPTALAAITYTRRVPRPRAGHEVERLLTLAGAARIGADRQPGPDVRLITPRPTTGSLRHGVSPRLRRAGARLDLGYEALALLRRAGGRAGPGLRDRGWSGRQRRWPRPSWRRHRGRAVSAAGELSLRTSAALIQRAAALVTNDSAPLHLATAVGTPIVALFGPTVPEFGFGPRRPGDVTLGTRRAGLPAVLQAWAPGLPAGTSSLHAGPGSGNRSRGAGRHHRCGGVRCDLSSELTSEARTWSSAAWPRMARSLHALGSEPTGAEAGERDVLDRLIALAKQTIEQTKTRDPRCRDHRRGCGGAGTARHQERRGPADAESGLGQSAASPDHSRPL